MKKMIRIIIHIDEDKCSGCGLCAEACHEGAMGMVPWQIVTISTAGEVLERL